MKYSEEMRYADHALRQLLTSSNAGYRNKKEELFGTETISTNSLESNYSSMHTIIWTSSPPSTVLGREPILEMILRAFPTGINQSYVSIEGSTVEDNGVAFYLISSHKLPYMYFLLF